MVLQGYMLYSFKEEKQYSDPTEIFDLRIYNKAKKSTGDNAKTGQFELSSPNDSRIFLASSENEMKDWIKHIKLAANSKKKSSSSSVSSNKRSSIRSNTNTASAKSSVSGSKKKSTSSKPSGSKKKSTTKPSASAKKKNGTTPSKKKGNGKKVSTKKKTTPSLSKSNSAQTPKSKKNTKPKALKVTNSSMDKHIARMQRNSHSKSKSHDTDILESATPTSSKKKKKSVKITPNPQQRSSVPNLRNKQYQQAVLDANNNNLVKFIMNLK